MVAALVAAACVVAVIRAGREVGTYEGRKTLLKRKMTELEDMRHDRRNVSVCRRPDDGRQDLG